MHSLTNTDDKTIYNDGSDTCCQKTYGLHGIADFRCRISENNFGGLLLRLITQKCYVNLLVLSMPIIFWQFYATAVSLGLDKQRVLTALSMLESVNGRFDYIVSGSGITGIVDYAHTPDALNNVLSTINEIRTRNESDYSSRLWRKS